MKTRIARGPMIGLRTANSTSDATTTRDFIPVVRPPNQAETRSIVALTYSEPVPVRKDGEGRYRPLPVGSFLVPAQEGDCHQTAGNQERQDGERQRRGEAPGVRKRGGRGAGRGRRAGAGRSGRRGARARG